MNYFSFLCFFWALVGLVSRFFILKMGEKWSNWELGKAYTASKPKWIYFLGVFGISIIIYTWYQVIVTEIRYSWIIAVLISLTLIKVFNLMFNYEGFREFVVNTLNNKKRWKLINIVIIVFSIILILMGIYLY